MAISKPRPNGMRQVYVYDPRVGKKVYVGSREKLRGPGGAQQLEREKAAEFAGQAPAPSTLTAAAYCATWLDLHHGGGTRRPAPSTRALNESNLRPFLAKYGARPLDGGVTRSEALAWAKKHRHSAKAVSAMYNDALDEEKCKANPFANRRQEQPRGRKDIEPITEDEVDRLAEIALAMWGRNGYGLVVSAWIMFASWVGCRPGETFAVTAADLNYAAGEVAIRRVKKRDGGVYPVDVVVLPGAAQDAIRAMPVIPAAGPIFRTVTGRPITKGSQRYVWDPVRKAFERELSPARAAELLLDRDLNFYELRHFCGSMMADRGLSEHDIAHQLGNSVQVCRETYIHAYRDRTNDRVRLALDGAKVAPLRGVG